MSRTAPRLEDLHPVLAAAVERLADTHRQAHPDTSMCLIWAHRTPDEQRAAHQAGRSKLDGVRRMSLHNYRPALAADVWVYTGGDDESPILYEGRPPKRDGMELQLLQRGSLRRWYMPMGKLAEEQGLEAGAMWRTFRDGPHIQMSRSDRVKALQMVLAERGYSPGPVDGICGGKTCAAVAVAGMASGRSWKVSTRQMRLMPCHPELWAWLHRPEKA
tara:strand:+ start:134 stop:784 length:651 start_codon:yes stop_codon:yes gene_type:complete